ncbi:uncharacterized protein K452DRAFT_313215 [Aplosporella prunicola CBS 121167]|uniref:Uncharacterized protein n=1 Tax=Aplosporella prunicola CBS 121167 TaxID=1176127 RepID=A0A6A6AXS5_9PEZI|nr:uncharacterized protein K452DRAFT_313215 [Aplosporella prunicola CBS 121167]KAF2136406.1 hypothetical protein K452DRAFT_313215 [Aplosporella prunicola CBS 121167]
MGMNIADPRYEDLAIEVHSRLSDLVISIRNTCFPETSSATQTGVEPSPLSHGQDLGLHQLDVHKVGQPDHHGQNVEPHQFSQGQSVQTSEIDQSHPVQTDLVETEKTLSAPAAIITKSGLENPQFQTTFKSTSGFKNGIDIQAWCRSIVPNEMATDAGLDAEVADSLHSNAEPLESALKSGKKKAPKRLLGQTGFDDQSPLESLKRRRSERIHQRTNPSNSS